ncbi:hypothetical protein F4553_005360 [Allocatelliglobosispora scoriae]|uniref:Uncharacterized protein n=1 Tax=Allocatelliglobosispora scoriae TaxID=643052 RepID=A0A841BZ87_9ACTN|nr:hypothetical protein [Allocatelliglobosispora scoriae]MBB5871981.1 hypothetical protein [Allocatelliglobosispora scoriae]
MTTDLEIWLIGDPATIDRACRALAGTGTIAQTGHPTAMGGTDRRVRRYLRIHPPMSTKPAPPAHRSADTESDLLNGSDQ